MFWLQSHPRIDHGRIGLIGHGKGGMVAAMLAVREPSVAFPVLLATPSLPGWQCVQLQTSYRLRAQDIKSESFEAWLIRQKRQLDFVMTRAECPGFARGFRHLVAQIFEEMTPVVRSLVGGSRERLQLSLGPMLSP